MNRRCIFGLPKSHHLGPAYRGFAGRGSYLRISCRHWGRRTTGEDDPQETFGGRIGFGECPAIIEASTGGYICDGARDG